MWLTGGFRGRGPGGGGQAGAAQEGVHAPPAVPG